MIRFRTWDIRSWCAYHKACCSNRFSSVAIHFRHTKTGRISLAILLLLAMLSIQIFGSTTASANGVPVRLFLNYLPDISNWGPETASGETTVAVGEGWVTMSVRDLPKLQDQVYVVWLVTDRNVPLPIGKFNTDDLNTGDFEIRGLSLPQEPYSLVLLTVEEDQEQFPFPGARRTVAGRFPDPELRAIVPTPFPTPMPSDSGNPGDQNPDKNETDSMNNDAVPTAEPIPTHPVPVLLPVTGQDKSVSGAKRPSMIWLFGSLVVTFMVGLGWSINNDWWRRK